MTMENGSIGGLMAALLEGLEERGRTEERDEQLKRLRGLLAPTIFSQPLFQPFDETEEVPEERPGRRRRRTAEESNG